MDVRRAAALTERLRAAGLRATRPRLAVAAALEDLGGHRTADEVHAYLEGHGVRLPRTSVYNVLSSLVTAGLALAADTGPGPARYEAGGDRHHHFVCRACGRVYDVPCAAGAESCLDAVDAPGRVEQAQVIFRGICAACDAR